MPVLSALLVLLVSLAPVSAAQEEAAPNLVAEHFYLSPEQHLRHQTVEMGSFVFVEHPDREQDSRYAIVTDFGKNVLRTRQVPGLKDMNEVRSWLRKDLETAEFEGVEIRKLAIPRKDGSPLTLYWVGHRAYLSADRARGEITLIRAVVEDQGEDFDRMVQDVKKYVHLPEEEPPVEIKSEAQYRKEEKLMLKYFDQLDIGEKLFGAFQGEALGEPLLWQSFGETTWRKTNLESRNFSDQVGFWTNRIVFKGIKAPLSTIDPYLEATTALESNGIDFKSHLTLFAGLEWRPLARNPWLYNYRPWGGIPILEWIRNYRFYVQYGNRKNIKDEIVNSAAHDLIAGVQIFYEWGVDPPPLDQPPPQKFSEYVEQYVWGEYFGNYRYEMTNFGSEDDFDAILLNSSVILGFRLPGIPLPENPINNKLVLMPYMRFEHVNNTELSAPFQNQYFVAAGMRWMPFRHARWQENEWLAKTKIFAEYVGIGKVQNAKQDGEAPNAVRYDLRFGVNISSRRF